MGPAAVLAKGLVPALRDDLDAHELPGAPGDKARQAIEPARLAAAQREELPRVQLRQLARQQPQECAIALRVDYSGEGVDALSLGLAGAEVANEDEAPLCPPLAAAASSPPFPRVLMTPRSL